MSKVKVATDEFGSVLFISPNNPEYGYIRVEQDSPVFSSKGWFDFKKRCAIIPGKTEDLKRAIENKFFSANKELPGKIVVKEQLEPIMASNLDFGVKRAGADGPILVLEDQVIYRRAFYTENMNESDILIQHTNVDEVKTANSNFNLVQYAHDIKNKKIKNEIETNIDQEVAIHASTIETKTPEITDDLEIPVTAESSEEVTFDF